MQEHNELCTKCVKNHRFRQASSSSPAEFALLKEKNLPRPPISSEIRWNSLHETLSYFCTHWSSIVVIVNEAFKPGDKIYRDMQDVGLKRVASELLQIFQPISIALDRLQNDSAVMGDVFDI